VTLLRQALLLCVALVGWIGTATAHEIPNAVAVRVLARPSADKFQLLVRVPLSSMRDVDIPALPSGYLDFAKLGPRLPDFAQTWIVTYVELYENGSRTPAARLTATQVSLKSDRSYVSFDAALARVREPLPKTSDNLVWEQVYFDVLLEFPIRSAQSTFALRPGLEHLAAEVVTSLEYYAPNGAVRPYQLHGDQGRVPLDPSWSQAAWRFLQLGFRHIPDGRDHVLFLLCLVIPFRRLRPLIWIVTAFTLAHSLTLAAAALGLAPGTLWFPALIEMLIAATVVYTALENIIGRPGEHRRAFLAFAFGLIHGFGFAFTLQDTLQFAGDRLITALVAFNLGVELGQLALIVILVPVVSLLFRWVDEHKGVIVVSALVAHAALHWLTDRAELLVRYDVNWTMVAVGAVAVALALTAAWFGLAKRRKPVGSLAPDSQA
jgi:hypothetical protein